MELDIVTKTIESLMRDRHAKQILMGTFFQSKSVKELSEKFEIPITTCSQKVQALERLGMLICDHSIVIPKDENIKYYRSDLLNNHVICKPNDIYMRFEVMPGLIKSYPRWITVKLLQAKNSTLYQQN